MLEGGSDAKRMQAWGVPHINAPTIAEIANELNERAQSHPVGTLQVILGHRRGKKLFRVPSQTVTEDWACHWGGRTELQFNIGLEDGERLRHGVAFDFGSTRSYSLEEMRAVLDPKLRLFNKFLGKHSDLYSDMFLWIDGTKHAVGSTSLQEMADHTWFFFGKKRKRSKQVDYELILDDFDRLFPLYQFVETGGKRKPVSAKLETRFCFQPGLRAKKRKTIVEQSNEQIERDLRHNELQKTLYRRLVRQFGKDNIGTENRGVNGTRIDLVVQRKQGYWFYEIKTADTVRACLREAVGQLLEYSFWPGAHEAVRLIVASELPIEKSAEEYLRRLRKLFSLPIDYEQIEI